MSTSIVTLPTNPSSGLPYFPAAAFKGLQLDVKRSIAFETAIIRAASGSEVAVSWREMPIITFDLTWDFLDDNDALIPEDQSGNAAYTEFATLMGFWQQQHGQLLPFYLRLSDLTKKAIDSMVTGQLIATGDGTTTTFQLCRTVGNYLEPIQMPDPAGTVTVYVNGVATSVTQLAGGIVQFASAPAAAALITADIPWVYLCRFDTDDAEWDQVYYLLHECKSLKLRTVIL